MAGELVVRMSPDAVPASSAATAADPTGVPPDPVSIQLSIVNTSGAQIDLSQAYVQISFPVDPGGGGSADALILAEPGVSPPTPFQTVQATPEQGTNWSINPFLAEPCAFLASPAPATGSTNPGVLAANGQGSITFIFSDIAVAPLAGVAPITVSLGGTPAPQGVSVAQTPPIEVTKTDPGFGITSFSASPVLVAPGQKTGLTWTTSAAAACTLVWSPPDTATVTDSSGTIITTGATVPTSAGTTGVNPFRATLTGPTSFLLMATGAGATQSASAFVDIARPILYLDTDPFPCDVAPFGSFTLSWSAFNTPTAPLLSWDPPDGGATVTLSDGTGVLPGQQVPRVASATVSNLSTFTEFRLTAGGGVQAGAVANLLPLSFTQLAYGQYEAADGSQYVALAWVVTDATSLDIEAMTRSATTWSNLAALVNPATLGSQAYEAPLTDVTTFRATAHGDDRGGVPPQAHVTPWLYPAPVQIVSFVGYAETANAPNPYTLLVWQVEHSTGVRLSFGYDTYKWDTSGEREWLGHYDELLWTGPQGYGSHPGPYVGPGLGIFTLVADGFAPATAYYPKDYATYALVMGIGVVNILDPPRDLADVAEER